MLPKWKGGVVEEDGWVAVAPDVVSSIAETVKSSAYEVMRAKEGWGNWRHRV